MVKKFELCVDNEQNCWYEFRVTDTDYLQDIISKYKNTIHEFKYLITNVIAVNNFFTNILTNEPYNYSLIDLRTFDEKYYNTTFYTSLIDLEDNTITKYKSDVELIKENPHNHYYYRIYSIQPIINYLGLKEKQYII